MKRLTIALAKIAYGLVLPLYLLWFVFFSHFQYQQADQIDAIRNKMEESLELLVNLHADENFFHALLQKNFSLADQHDLAQKALQNRIRALHRAFPDAFKFIVWNSSGQVNQQLSEENSFQYVLKSMFQVSREILQHYRTVIPPDPANLPAVQQRIKLLRGYFGQFLLPELMIEFFRPSYAGRAITVSESIDKRKLWVYSGRNFSVAVFISARILKQRIGPRMLISNFNRRNSAIKLGYFTTLNYLHAGLPKTAKVVNKFKLETRKFEENAVSLRQIGDYLLLLRQVSPELIVLAYLDKKSELTEPAAAANTAFFGLLKWLLVFLFIVYCFSLKGYRLSLSVQHKFLLLLFFANGLPALILVSTGYEYFTEKKAAMIDAQQRESLRILKEIDSRYPAIRKGFARELNLFIDEKNRQFEDGPWNQAEIEELRKFILGFDPGMVLMLNKERQSKINFNRSSRENVEGFFKDFLWRSLDFVSNNNLRRRGEEGKSTLESISSEDLIYLDFLSILNQITLQNTGTTVSWTYMKLLGDFRSFNSWGILAAIWNREDMLRTFVEKEFSKIETEVFPRQLAVMETGSKMIMPATYAENSRLKRLLHQTMLRRQLTENNLTIDEQKYLFCAMAGSEIQDAVLMTVYPVHLIEAEVARFKLALFVVGLITLLVLYQIVKLSSQKLLGPVEGLAAGIDQLHNRNFRYRISSAGEDELGQLVSAFNSTMEGLQELAVGTAVQESLLPDENFSSGQIRLFARSLFMTKMGGDYFDYFESEPGRLGVVFGDVAGHGIPAAVIMAMAKAAVASASLKFKTPADMLQQANHVLLHLKERKLRRMMTCQCLDINSLTGDFTLANAGHCYPVHIKNNGTETCFVEANGMPLGNKVRKPYEIARGKLEPGDILVLYTDGIIEAANQAGEMFDYGRFLELLKTSFNQDLEVFWQGIIEGNRNWAEQQDDDLTFMLIRFEP